MRLNPKESLSRPLWNREISWFSSWNWLHAIPVLIYFEIAFYLLAVPNTYGMVHDYGYTLATMLSDRIYFLKNGFFHLPYYSPAFAGGTPRYGDIGDMTFSVVQWAFNLMPSPRSGLVLGFLICLLLAYAGAYRFLRQFELQPFIAMCGAFLFSLNGFMINRWVVGHLIFHSYWAIPWVLLHFYKALRNVSDSELCYRALWVGLLLSLMIYSTGYYIMIFTLLLALSLLLTEFLFHKRKLQISLEKLLAAGIGSLLIMLLLSASKLLPARDYVRQFPTVGTNEYVGFNVLPVLLRGLMDPTIKLTTRFAYFSWGWWEYSCYIGITTFAFAIAALFMILFRRDDENAQDLRTIKYLGLWTTLTTVMSVYLAMGMNIGWLFLKMLPIFDSMHVTPRFIGLLALPWIALGMTFLDHLCVTRRKTLAAAVLCCICGIDLLGYHARNDDRIFTDRWVVKDPSIPLEHFMIHGWIERGTDPMAVANGFGDLLTYNPLFGHNAEKIPENLDYRRPPWYQFKDGSYNMHDPAALIYPREMDEPPWTRLSGKTPTEQVRRFLAFEDPHFFVPLRQKVTNWLSLISVWITVGILFFLSRKNGAHALAAS